MILSVSHLKKSFITDVIIKDATFHLEDNECTCLVGLNGAGKTTLFRLIYGDLPYDEGEVYLRKDATVGFLRQHSDLDSERDVYHEALSEMEDVFLLEDRMRSVEAEMANAKGEMLDSLMKEHEALLFEFEQKGGYALESEVVGVLKGLGFTEKQFTLPVSALSGGEKTRVQLAGLLLKKPDLLLLDEPTNHLDMHAIDWLEGYLKNYGKAVFCISHDRYFMDRIADKIIDLERGQTYVYRGNYSEFTVKKEAKKEEERRAYEAQQKHIQHEKEVIMRFRSYNRERFFVKAKSREKLLTHLTLLEKPQEEKSDMLLRLEPNILSGKDVITIENLTKGFEEKTLFQNASIEIKRGEKVTLIGDNGTGKSTLLKMITGSLRPDSGEIILGTNVYIGYYDQEHQNLSEEKTAFSEIHDEHPLFTESKVRGILGAFLFSGDDVFKQVQSLSGGEKGRLSLAKLMLSDSNLLILDEPTNHLDMASREILENAVSSYEGTVLSVSHDRYYINMVSTRIIELYRGQFIDYRGDYDYYLEKRDEFHSKTDALFSEPLKKKAEPSEQQLIWQEKKKLDAEARKKEKQIQKTEEMITLLEEEIQKLECELLNPEISSNAAELNRILEEKTGKEKELETLYTLWESLQ